MLRLQYRILRNYLDDQRDALRVAWRAYLDDLADSRAVRDEAELHYGLADAGLTANSPIEMVRAKLGSRLAALFEDAYGCPAQPPIGSVLVPVEALTGSQEGDEAWGRITQAGRSRPFRVDLGGAVQFRTE